MTPTVTVTVTGDDFLASPPDVQDAVLDGLEIDTRLEVTLCLHDERNVATSNATREQEVEVDLRAAARRDATAVIVSRCSADRGAFSDQPQAIGRAARCATDGLLVGLGEEPAR